MERPGVNFCGVAVLLVGLVTSCLGISATLNGELQKIRGTPMHKVQLTQKGYIQFLRWELPVPDFKEFTFCLWLTSTNLTHPHSIFSYSKNERDRLVRAWISPHGRSVHLEIAGAQIFVADSDIRENQWYHLCQSWEGRNGRYALWIDGRLHAHGRSKQTRGHVIPSGGDIVLGQEYTDFDKGLEEGVEGSVLGFNLLLASSFTPLPSNQKEARRDAISQSSSNYALPFFARIPMKIMRHDVDYILRVPVSRRRRRTTRNGRDVLRISQRPRGIQLPRETEKIELSSIANDPLGLQLVKLSYVRCEIGRGSPYIGGPLMLISWSRTPVRVFGGATLKNVSGGCGNF